MSTIGLAMIVRNAGKTITECLDSIAPYVDEIIIGFGGKSTDGTEQIVEDYLIGWAKTADALRVAAGKPSNEAQAAPFKMIQLDWRDNFAWARNEVWSQLTTEYGYWQDADDVLVNGDKLAGYIKVRPEANCFFAPYHYQTDEYGNLACTLWRERLVKNPREWSWEGAIHEVLIGDPAVPLVPVNMPDVVVRHSDKREMDKGTRNLDILYAELERTEPEPNQRLLLYLFRENAGRGNIKEALMHANRFIARAVRDDESYQVAVGIVDLLRRVGRMDLAKKSALKAIEMRPEWPDAYFMLARIAYEQGNPRETIEWTKAGETKDPPQTASIIDPRTYTYWPRYFLGLAYNALGDYEMAVDNLNRAAAVVPDEQIARVISDALHNAESQKVLNAFLYLREVLGRNDEWIKARKLFEVAPKAIEMAEPVMRAHLRTIQQTAHIDDPQVMVDFYKDNPGWFPMPEEHLWGAWLDNARVKFIRDSVTCAPPATILDVGSSDGFISLHLAAMGHIVEGWDLDPRCADKANERAQERGLRAHYRAGSIENVEGKFDVAIATEIIEHLVDPAAFLDQVDEHARKVVVTTPFLSYEMGRQTDWDKVEPKGHIRIFDLTDVEALLTGRGRIFDLYRQANGLTGWIFASYRPRQSYGAGSIDFLAPGTLEEWSPRKYRKEGLGGSETALIRLAEELFISEGDTANSYRCTVYSRIDEPGYYNGVRYRGAESFDPGTHSDVLVAWRYPEAADLPVRADRMVLWMHDVDAGDRLTPARASRFERIVVLSEWHKQHMIETYPFITEEKYAVIGNGVDVARFAPRSDDAHQLGDWPEREPHRVAYTSSPDRGLDVILARVWPRVTELVPDAELHVYYGLNNINALAPGYPQIAAFRQQLGNLLLDSKNVINHGRIPQDELARELQKASVWLYPAWSSLGNAPFDETYCISAVEAQLAGCIPVAASHGALAETVVSGVVIPDTIDKGDVAEGYARAVAQALLADNEGLLKLREQIRTDAPAYDWADIAAQWSSILQSHDATDRADAS